MEIIIPNNKEILTILKPDAFLQPSFIVEEYFEYITQITDKPLDCYEIKNWSHISSYIYEQDISCLNDMKEITKKRKQLLTTILGYHELFNNKHALAVFIKTSDPEHIISVLNEEKKQLRKKYVYGTNKYFIEFQSELNEMIKSPLYNIDLNSLKFKIREFSNDSDIESDDKMNMIFFNKIHVPSSINENDFEKELILKKCKK